MADKRDRKRWRRHEFVIENHPQERWSSNDRIYYAITSSRCSYGEACELALQEKGGLRGALPPQAFPGFMS